MIQLPHLYVLQYLKRRFQELRAYPQELECLLSAYLDPAIEDIYGHEYVCGAIKWIQENEIFFVLGSRLDIDKLPSVAVTYEGGIESTQFLGDVGQTQQFEIEPTKYADFAIKDIEDGDLIVSAAENITQKIWRGLVLRNGPDFSANVKDFLPDGDDTRIVLSKPASLDEVSLQDWAAYSFVDTRSRSFGSSLDSVRVRVYVTIPGDPEHCEMVSTVIRYLLKQARLFLERRGMHEVTTTHGALSRSADFDESQVWVVEFSLEGKIHDQWIISEFTQGDNFCIDLYARSTDEKNEAVRVWQQQET